MAHGGCSSAVESQIVDLVVAGSNPVIHPKPLWFGMNLLAANKIFEGGKGGVRNFFAAILTLAGALG